MCSRLLLYSLFRKFGGTQKLLYDLLVRETEKFEKHWVLMKIRDKVDYLFKLRAKCQSDNVQLLCQIVVLHFQPHVRFHQSFVFSLQPESLKRRLATKQRNRTVPAVRTIRCKHLSWPLKARNQLGTAVAAMSFLRGAQIFQPMFNTHFSKGGGASPPSYGPVAAVLVQWQNTEDNAKAIYERKTVNFSASDRIM